jgi:hypothetical protein
MNPPRIAPALCFGALIVFYAATGCSAKSVDPSKPETMLNPKMSTHQKQIRLAHAQQTTE